MNKYLLFLLIPFSMSCFGFDSDSESEELVIAEKYFSEHKEQLQQEYENKKAALEKEKKDKRINEIIEQRRKYPLSLLRRNLASEFLPRTRELPEEIIEDLFPVLSEKELNDSSFSYDTETVSSHFSSGDIPVSPIGELEDFSDLF